MKTNLNQFFYSFYCLQIREKFEVVLLILFQKYFKTAKFNLQNTLEIKVSTFDNVFTAVDLKLYNLTLLAKYAE